MEVSKLLEIARIKLSDPLAQDGSDEGSLFTTDELIYYINNALKEAVVRGKLIVSGTYSISLTDGTGSYAIPDGAVLVDQILDENNERIVKIHEVDLDSKSDDWRTDTEELPYYFMQNLVNNSLLFYPIPSKDSTVSVRASSFPEEVDSSDEIPTELSEYYHHDLIWWVLYEAFDKKDADTYDPGKSLENKRRFTNAFGEKLSANVFQEATGYPDNPGTLRDY